MLCKQCKRLLALLAYQRRRSDVSPARRTARQQPSSSFKLKYLSLASVAKRRKAAQVERSADKAKLARLVDTELLLDDEQSNELSESMSQIEEANVDELQKAFKEADSFSVGDSVRVA